MTDEIVISNFSLTLFQRLKLDNKVEQGFIESYLFEGEAQVYTVGTIGGHNVVSTKLSRIGLSKGAMVAAGNVVTRLLGELFPHSTVEMFFKQNYQYVSNAFELLKSSL